MLFPLRHGSVVSPRPWSDVSPGSDASTIATEAAATDCQNLMNLPLKSSKFYTVKVSGDKMIKYDMFFWFISMLKMSGAVPEDGPM